MVKIEQSQLLLLKSFVDLCRDQPDVLHQPEMKFFADWIVALGGTIPAKTVKPETPPPRAASPPTESDEEPIELDDLGGVIPSDVIDENSLPLGNPDVEVSEEASDQASELRAQAQSSSGTPEEAIRLLSEAILLNPKSAVLFAKRADMLIREKKPMAAIRDYDNNTRALELNENSAAALKWLGRAHRLLGHWADAYTAFCKAQRIDFDDQVAEWIAEVKPNALKIADHERLLERKAEEKRDNERRERVRMAQEANKRAQEQQAKHTPDSSQFNNILNDPEIMAALLDITKNPANLSKYANNPKLMNILKDLGSKFGGAGGFADLFGGGGGSNGDENKKDEPEDLSPPKPPKSSDDLD